MRLLFVDNYDSFTQNVVHLLAAQGVEPDVVLTDDAMLANGANSDALDRYDAVVIGPGPGNPGQLPHVLALIRAAAQREKTVFGVCLGMQAIAQAFGARVVHAPKPMHGKPAQIAHNGKGLFAGVPSPLTATRYHSLCVDEATLPQMLRAAAHSEDGVVQAIEHPSLPIAGVQFHPESVLSEHGERIVRNALRIDTPAPA